MAGFIRDGADLTADVAETCDVCIVGSGAGGAVLAAGLVAQGLDVVMLEAGPAVTATDFTLHEREAYPNFYQDRGGRSTADLAITILQGRTVGGSTTVNWTTCYRTPARILDHWRATHGIDGLDPDTLAPHFAAVEARLNIHAWDEAIANTNNRALLDGARALGWQVDATRRNVKGCANSGYCGLGCPVDGKQAMHVTYLADAVAGGLRLYADVEARAVVTSGGRATGVEAQVLQRGRTADAPQRVRVKAKVVVASGGAINTPALLLRSGLDGGGRVGTRTWIHPVTGVSGVYDQPVNGFYGAPQSIASHQFIDRGPERIGYFMETAPVQPMLISLGVSAVGDDLAEAMGQLDHMSVLLALAVDGLLPHEQGGTVSLRGDGRLRIDYPVGETLAESMKASTRSLAQVHLAAGATRVLTLHPQVPDIRSVDDLDKLDALSYGAHQHNIFTAHQMGGCAMGPDPAGSVVGPDHRFHGVPNLFVVDGSVLPTALGVNPSETIYGLAHRARAFVGEAV